MGTASAAAEQKVSDVKQGIATSHERALGNPLHCKQAPCAAGCRGARHRQLSWSAAPSPAQGHTRCGRRAGRALSTPSRSTASTNCWCISADQTTRGFFAAPVSSLSRRCAAHKLVNGEDRARSVDALPELRRAATRRTGVTRVQLRRTSRTRTPAAVCGGLPQGPGL